ncbi:MAG TPA: tetratricopeptide repeat protein [Pyrinomonadaceae bacterium]|nr:tetratricopeptide repeat protein [Pyrinomonadaceae bacterium]
MIRKYFFAIVAAAVLLCFMALTAVAQNGELRGHVFLQTADGQKVPLADAVIDVFRTDLKAEYHLKTDKKGEFVHAGLPYVGEYTIAASHPSAAPNFVTNFRVGRDIPCDIVLTPGDGKRLTFEQLKAAGSGSGAPVGAAGSAKGGDSAVDKAKLEELKKKNAEIEEKNKKITESNATINRTFKAGNDALIAGMNAGKTNNSDEAIQKYTEAVTQYDEGLAADAEQPALLTQKATALKARGVERFNAAIKSKTMDDAAKGAAMETAKNDFKAAAEASGKASALIKASTAPTDPAEVNRFNANRLATYQVNAEALRLVASKADPTKADEAAAAFKDYIGVEPDAAKKAKAQLDSAQMLLDAGQSDKALTEFQAILATNPDSPEANVGAGLAPYATQDKAKFQEAANYLQHFVDVAPDNHPFKDDAKAILAEMKNTEKIIPEKTPTRRKRP